MIRYGVVGNISACHADARGSIPRFGVFFSELGHCKQTGSLAAPVRLSYDHTTVKAPHPIRTAKLSTVGPDQYFGRGLQGISGVVCLFIFFENFSFFISKKKKKVKKIRGGRFELPTNGWLRLRTLQSTALPLSYPRTSALDLNPLAPATTLRDRSFAVQGHAVSAHLRSPLTPR